MASLCIYVCTRTGGNAPILFQLNSIQLIHIIFRLKPDQTAVAPRQSCRRRGNALISSGHAIQME